MWSVDAAVQVVAVTRSVRLRVHDRRSVSVSDLRSRWGVTPDNVTGEKNDGLFDSVGQETCADTAASTISLSSCSGRVHDRNVPLHMKEAKTAVIALKQLVRSGQGER